MNNLKTVLTLALIIVSTSSLQAMHPALVRVKTAVAQVAGRRVSATKPVEQLRSVSTNAKRVYPRRQKRDKFKQRSRLFPFAVGLGTGIIVKKS
jgi:hypothetical protein